LGSSSAVLSPSSGASLFGLVSSSASEISAKF